MISANWELENKAIDKYNFLKRGEDGVLEIYADHHMLSTFRTCEQKFVTEIIDRIIPIGKNWSLDFGIVFHQWMEWFHEAEDKNFTGNWDEPFSLDHTLAQQWGVDLQADSSTEGGYIYDRINHVSWITRCRKYWVDNNLEQFNDKKGFKDLNGWQGAMTLLLEYWQAYGDGKERLRTVGTELCFGKDKEVPILVNHQLFPLAPFRCYLTGRIDRVVDNGRVIGPMDHKTHSFFKGGEFERYKPHDAFIGYVYALQQILSNYPADRKCNSVIIDMVALKRPGDKSKDKQRFKRASREYYPADIGEFINRTISSFSMLYQVVVLGRPPQWNTQACHNQYYRPCQYRVLHEASIDVRNAVQSQWFQIREKAWNPYPVKGETNLITDDNDE